MRVLRVGVAAVAAVTWDRYVSLPEPGRWLCSDCDQVATRLGYSSGSAAQIVDRDRHDRWHERQPFGGLAL